MGIQVGTAIATLVRKADHAPVECIGFRHLWGQGKREELLETAEAEPGELYADVSPLLPLGLPFVQTAVSEGWFDWPALPELFPVSFPGVQTSRDGFLVDTDLDLLKARIGDYFDPTIRHEEVAQRYPSVMRDSVRFDARAVRDVLLSRGGPNEDGFVRHAYRPFDNRWLYWEADGGLLDRPRADYQPNVFRDNLWLCNAQHVRKGADEPQAYFTRHTGARHLIERGANWFPAWLRDDSGSTGRRPNLSGTARRFLERLGLSVEDLFHHVLATLHDPAYRKANAGALRMEWPRIPLPGWPAPGTASVSTASERGSASSDRETTEAADALARSAAQGRELAALLNPDAPVSGVTTGPLRPEIAAIAVPATTDGRNMTGDDFALTAGWGHVEAGGAVMPGQGQATERAITPDERAAVGDTLPTLGKTTFDIHLNDRAFWRNVPAAVWNYKLGGYQVLKKWLSYRERDILDRPLRPDEVQHFTDTTRRIAALLMKSG